MPYAAAISHTSALDWHRIAWQGRLNLFLNRMHAEILEKDAIRGLNIICAPINVKPLFVKNIRF